jgi:hypothetical protein
MSQPETAHPFGVFLCGVCGGVVSADSDLLYWRAVAATGKCICGDHIIDSDDFDWTEGGE